MKEFNLPLVATVNSDVLDSKGHFVGLYPTKRVDQALAIARAVNYHDKILKALRGIMKETKYIDDWGRCKYCKQRISKGHVSACPWFAASHLLENLRNGS